MKLKAKILFFGLWFLVFASTSFGQTIKAGYDRMYQGDPAGALQYFRELNSREPQNLAGAFGVLMAMYETGLQQQPAQKEFEQRIDQLIQSASARYEKSKQDADALFYLTQGYLHRGRYRVDFDKGIWGAARDGVNAKNYADAYIKMDPNRADAYVAAGLYNYYIDIAPVYFSFFRFLLFMPKGNRAEGIKQLERAGREGELWAAFAQNLLIDIYRSENRFDDAVRTAESLQKKCPDNPKYQFDLAELYSLADVGDYEKAALQYADIVERAEKKHPNYKLLHRYQATLNLARMREQQWRPDDAIATVNAVIDSNVTQPEWAVPNSLLARGNYRAMQNDPHATDDAKRILSDIKWKKWHENALNQIKAIEQRQKSAEAAVYAELILANRLTAEHRWDAARQNYDAIRAKHPDDWQVRYRIAYLEFARANYNVAETGFTEILNSAAAMPAWIKPFAMLNEARIDDLRGKRDQATKLYKRIVDEKKNSQAADAARRGLISPYRRPPSAALARS